MMELNKNEPKKFLKETYGVSINIESTNGSKLKLNESHIHQNMKNQKQSLSLLGRSVREDPGVSSQVFEHV